MPEARAPGPTRCRPQFGATAPDAVAEVRVTHTGGRLQVSWDAPARATHYDVTYSVYSSLHDARWNTSLHTARAAWRRAGTSLTIHCDSRTGQACVSPAGVYVVGVRARNAAGESAWTNSAPAASVPGPVAQVRVVHKGSSLEVSWDAAARATHYDVTYTNTGSGENARAAWNRAGTSLTITCDSRYPGQNRHCVESGATYTVGVRARNAGGGERLGELGTGVGGGAQRGGRRRGRARRRPVGNPGLRRHAGPGGDVGGDGGLRDRQGGRHGGGGF